MGIGVVYRVSINITVYHIRKIENWNGRIEIHLGIFYDYQNL